MAIGQRDRWGNEGGPRAAVSLQGKRRQAPRETSAKPAMGQLAWDAAASAPSLLPSWTLDLVVFSTGNYFRLSHGNGWGQITCLPHNPGGRRERGNGAANPSLTALM